MKKIQCAAAMALILALVQMAFAAGIANIPWSESNLETLRGFDRTAVAQFATELLGNFSGHGDSPVVKPKDIGEFTWADLEGDGQYELIMTLDVNGRAFFNALEIFWRDQSGNITHQEIGGWAFHDLNEAIRDLNGDGKDELIVPTRLLSYSTAETFTWPVVYRIKDRRYVEASRDFPAFYKDEVLPQLDKKISAPATKTIPGLDREETRAVLSMERAKILRVIGSDPTAGLQQAYQWMSSDDPRLLQNAAATFQDIGGHENELRATTQAYQNALARERAAHQGS